MNLANKLTLSRIFMIPVFVFFLMKDTADATLIAGGIFIIASITDFFDGYIARSRNLVTKFGKFMDPLADKLLVISAFICFVELQIVPSWAIIIIISRELIVSIFRAIAASDGIVIAAGSLGKYKTATQMVAVIVFCLNPLLIKVTTLPIAMVLFYLCTTLTLLSGFDYIYKNRQIINDV